MKYKVDWRIFAFTIMFAIGEARYFGWNCTIDSDAEMISNGILMLLLASSCYRTEVAK